VAAGLTAAFHKYRPTKKPFNNVLRRRLRKPHAPGREFLDHRIPLCQFAGQSVLLWGMNQSHAACLKFGVKLVVVGSAAKAAYCRDSIRSPPRTPASEEPVKRKVVVGKSRFRASDPNGVFQ